MIDISDGLAIDLSRLVVGADLSAAAIPRRETLEQALYEGEDYELLVAARPATAARIEKKDAIRIGTVSKEPGIRVHHHGGRIEVIEPRGFEHRFGMSTAS